MTDQWFWLPALDRAIARWTGTPWMAGQRWPGRGVDCVNFVDAVLCQVRGVKLPALAREPQDLAQHNHRDAMKVCNAIARRHPHKIIRDASREPGDVLVVRAGRGPAHVMILSRPLIVWHAVAGCGVCSTSLAATESDVVRVFRPLDKSLWL